MNTESTPLKQGERVTFEDGHVVTGYAAVRYRCPATDREYTAIAVGTRCDSQGKLVLQVLEEPSRCLTAIYPHWILDTLTEQANQPKQ